MPLISHCVSCVDTAPCRHSKHLGTRKGTVQFCGQPFPHQHQSPLTAQPTESYQVAGATCMQHQVLPTQQHHPSGCDALQATATVQKELLWAARDPVDACVTVLATCSANMEHQQAWRGGHHGWCATLLTPAKNITSMFWHSSNLGNNSSAVHACDVSLHNCNTTQVLHTRDHFPLSPGPLGLDCSHLLLALSSPHVCVPAAGVAQGNSQCTPHQLLHWWSTEIHTTQRTRHGQATQA
jgi:hypothetical protein